MNYLVSGSGKITVMVGGGTPLVATPEHPNYEQIKTALKAKDEAALVRLMDVPKAVAEYAAGVVKVQGGEVFYRDKPIQNGLTTRLLALMNGGFPFEPLAKFLENLMQNPSARAVKELYQWLEHKDIVLTDDGCWLGYKRLFKATNPDGSNKTLPDGRQVWVDCHTKKIEQAIGMPPVPMERNEVDDNWGVDCSDGYHVGSMSYVRNFNENGDVVIVKVNPRDTVTVPTNETTKCRVTGYDIIAVYTGDLTAPLYNGQTAQPVESPIQSGWDADSEDDDDDEDDDSDLDDDDDFDDEEDEDDDDDSPEVGW